MTEVSSDDSKDSKVGGAAMPPLADLPSELPGDKKRHAIGPLRGYEYQIWCSIDAWLQLANDREVVYLEGAEDIDRVGPDAAIAVQVKDRADPISLGNAKTREAIENFWRLASASGGRVVTFHYLTTATVTRETDAAFDGLAGIEAWRAAQTNPDLAGQVRNYLRNKLDSTSPLRSFLESATIEEIQAMLIRRFQWFTEQPDADVVRGSVTQRLQVLLTEQERPVELASLIRDRLHARCWQIATNEDSSQRCLTREELVQCIESAVALQYSLPPALPDGPETGLLDLLLLKKAPPPPELLLQRPELIAQIETLVNQRRVALLTGTVYKGKTTIAQQVAAARCPDAWWVGVSERSATEVDNVLLALASRIERGNCPPLVVIDDLDIGPAAHRVYVDSLRLVMHRALATGRSMLLTARGASGESAIAQDFRAIELVDIPALTTEQITALCAHHGCPTTLTVVWGVLVAASSGGHPKLVQIRLAELQAKSWPKPNADDLMGGSTGMTTAKQLSRKLLADSLGAAAAEVVYMISECTVPLHRDTAVKLAEDTPGITNPGDVIDGLTGTWLERIEEGRIRATHLLQGVAKDAWSEEKRKVVHIRLHDAILAHQPLTPSEGAALVTHAFLGGSHRRLASTGMKLQVLANDEAQREVERHLLWLPFVALGEGQTITPDDPVANVILRQLQFRVAVTLDADTLPAICERWLEDASRVTHKEMRGVMLTMLVASIGISMSPKVPLRARLKAIELAREIPESHRALLHTGAEKFFAEGALQGFPATGTEEQIYLMCARTSIKGLEGLSELVAWLDTAMRNDLLRELDEMVNWPIVQAMGAFVHGAWAPVHEEVSDWSPWLETFDRLEDVAMRRSLPNLGREATKASAIALTEELGRPADALAKIEQAEKRFGPSHVLTEQRANVLFHNKDDAAVLQVWDRLTGVGAEPIRDPYAFRRAGISAARLKLWERAESIFLAGAESIADGLEGTKFGLRADAALSACCGGNQVAAVRHLVTALQGMPSSAADEGDPQWEALQRVAVGVCRRIEAALWKPDKPAPLLEPGGASSPSLKMPTPEKGQPLRTSLTRAQVYELAAELGVATREAVKPLGDLLASKSPFVRWEAACGLLAVTLAAGAQDGFVQSLMNFDRAAKALLARKLDEGITPEDAGYDPSAATAPEQWFGIVVAAVVCSGPALIATLRQWESDAQRLLGNEAQFTKLVRRLLTGATTEADKLQSTVQSTQEGPVRCGAAAQLLLGDHGAEQTLRLQAFLVSAMVSDVSTGYQPLFNCHVARALALVWRRQAESPFQFRAPRTSVPELLAEIERIEGRGGTIAPLLTKAAAATGLNLGPMIGRLK